MDLSVEDFKNVLLDLYLAQRDAADLRFKLAELQKAISAPEGQADEEV